MYNAKLWLGIALLAFCFVSCEEDEEPEPEPGTTSGGTVTLDCDYFTTARVLADNPDVAVDYLVPCRAEVTASLVIEPGVVIAFATDAGLRIRGQGSISAIGQLQEPIVFQGETETKGSWTGILVETNNVSNQLSQVEVKHAGGAAFTSIYRAGSVTLGSNSRLSLTNSLITEGETYGLSANCGDCKLEFMGNVINDTETPVVIASLMAHSLGGNGDMAGNTNDFVEVLIGSSGITDEVAWQMLSIPYRVVQPGLFSNLVVGASGGLTIEEGVTVEFGPNVGIGTADNGYLNIAGTMQNPVILTGATEAPGAWKGIGYLSDNINNRITHAEISYAGSGDWGSFVSVEGTIMMWSSSRLDISNSILRDGGAPCGIEATNFGINLTNTNNTFTNITTDVCM